MKKAYRAESKRLAAKAIKDKVDVAKFNARIRQKYHNDALSLVRGKNPHIKGFVKMKESSEEKPIEKSALKPKSEALMNLQVDLANPAPTPPNTPKRRKRKKRIQSFIQPKIKYTGPVYQEQPKMEVITPRTRPLATNLLKLYASKL